MSSVVPQDSERQALKNIGEQAWTIMIGEVKNGSINPQKMRDFAYMHIYALGSEIGGNHVRRMKRSGVDCDDGELQKILSDWWTLPETSCARGTLHDLSTDAALENLSCIFKHFSQSTGEIH